MNTSLGDYLTSINYTKQDIMREDDSGVAASKYPAYIIRRLLSYHPDAIYEASIMNIFHELPSQMQFDFLREGLSKRKRFSRLEKGVKDTLDKINLISDYYECNTRKARDLLKILSDDDIAAIRIELSKGGTRK